jgi:hypothetical protein
MERAILSRGESTSEGTFGKLFFGEKWEFTLELPWKENASNISCIPKGVYKCRYTLSPRMKKWTYEVLGTGKRAGIRIHSANLACQLLGCISLGEQLGKIDGVKAVLVSRPAITQLENYMNRSDFELEVR